MTIELRKALRRARLENGRILCGCVGNDRRIGVYCGFDRLIGWFTALEEAEYYEALNWWARFGDGPAPRDGRITRLGVHYATRGTGLMV